MANVLGISFGRKMSNCDVMVKHVLMQCKDAGHEVHFLRADDLDIKPCTGCISCVVGMCSGRGKGGCILKDDFAILDEALMQCDAIVIGCPTYETSPTGKFKIICDRIGPSHDISFRKLAYEEGVAAGKDPATLPDPRTWKKRVGVLISVGGAMTENWTAMMHPMMYEMTFSMGIDVIDKYNYYGAMAHEHVLGNEPVMARMTEMGAHVVDALAADSEEARVAWRGDEAGICPVCHCDLLQVSHDRRSIECPVCGIAGELTIEDGQIRAHFDPSQCERSRLRWAGKLEHSTEIKTKAVGPGQIPDLKVRKAPYIGFAEN